MKQNLVRIADLSSFFDLSLRLLCAVTYFAQWRFVRVKQCICFLFFGLLQALPASATVLYESAGNLDYFTTNNENGTGRQGWVVRDYRPTFKDITQYPAMPFVISQQSNVTSVELALTGALGNYFAQIRSDNNGLPDSSPIWTGSRLQDAPGFQPIRDQHYSFTGFSGDSVQLEANTKYWLYLGCIANCELSWWSNPANAAPGAIESNTLYPFNMQWHLSDDYAAMFRVTGSFSNTDEPVQLPEVAVPEPASALLFAAGLAAMGVGRRKSKDTKGNAPFI